MPVVNITILGPGAIGSLYASKLTLAGHNVSLWGRQSAESISIQLDSEPLHSFANKNAHALKHSDLLIVTLKAWQVETALSPLLDILHCDTIILFLHNGMGCVDKMTTKLKPFPVLLGTSTHGALRKSDTQVKHTGLGETKIGAWNEKGLHCQFVTDVLNHAISPVHWHDTIQQALWTKLVINCAINPLTAIENCKNGQLSRSDYANQIAAIIKEALLCAACVGVVLDEQVMTTTVFNVISNTAENYSSMQQDIDNKRPSEIDFITGYLVRIAKQYQLHIPANAAMLNQIKHIEASWSEHD
ncbi:2-dehydropantoate 2-reductase [Vibrio sp. 10N.286.49.C2]|uniref:2-dehydropantoate 2-reductase n=1 Tax=Vibrio sp. 10N.286.49.C2 TaxID=1880856 RepID=UPI0026BE55EE